MKQFLQACLPSALALVPAMAAQPSTLAVPQAPAVLPGRGLAEHDFFYAGEAKDERMFIVKKGQIVWSHTHPGRGEVSDAVLLPNGNVLFAHQYAITEITADKQVVWNYDAPANTEIHTAQPFGTGSVWFIQNGNPAKFMVVNKTSGKTEREFVLPVKNPKGVHGQFRQARMTDARTLLVAHMDLGKAVEYDLDGKALWSVDVPCIWSLKLDPANPSVQAIEVTREKKIVWVLRAWVPPADLGPSTTIQILDEPGTP